MAGFRPLHDRVLVKRVEAEEKTPGGMRVIPEQIPPMPAHLAEALHRSFATYTPEATE